MKRCGFIIILIWFTLDLECITAKRKCETIQGFNKRSGEPIAIDNLIQKYEREHQKLYNEEPRDGAKLKWPHLQNQNLSSYCSNYLQNFIGKAKIDNVIGTKTVKELQYLKEKTNFTSRIVVVQCRYKSRLHYVIRASKPNCVYAVERKIDDKLLHRFNIINEYCDFEDDLLFNVPLKRRRQEMTSTVNRRSGQPIAKDKYLLQYELEHEVMLNKEGNEGKHIEWPPGIPHHNLDSYCYQYMKEIVPNRYQEGIRGILKTEKLLYQKLNKNMYVNVKIVSCIITIGSKLQYYLTRAPETNCVYALLRQGHYKQDPMVIVFKHCDFEKSNSRLTISQNKGTFDKNMISKNVVKEEVSDQKEILELFPKY